MTGLTGIPRHPFRDNYANQLAVLLSAMDEPLQALAS